MEEVLGNPKGESEQVYWTELGLKQHEVQKEYFDQIVLNGVSVLQKIFKRHEHCQKSLPISEVEEVVEIWGLKVAKNLAVIGAITRGSKQME